MIVLNPTNHLYVFWKDVIPELSFVIVLCQKGIADSLRRFIELKRLHTQCESCEIGSSSHCSKSFYLFTLSAPTIVFFLDISASLTFHFAAVPAPIFFPPSLSATIWKASSRLPTHAQNCQTLKFLHSKIWCKLWPHLFGNCWNSFCDRDGPP